MKPNQLLATKAAITRQCNAHNGQQSYKRVLLAKGAKVELVEVNKFDTKWITVREIATGKKHRNMKADFFEPVGSTEAPKHGAPYFEDDDGGSWWIDLAEGYTVDGCSAVHERTKKQAVARLCEARIAVVK